MQYKLYPYLDKRSTGKDGKHPVKIAIGYDRKTDYIHSGISCSAEDWEIVYNPKAPKHLRELKEQIQAVETRVKDALATMAMYDLNTLRRLAGVTKLKVIKPTPLIRQAHNVFDWFDVKIKELEEQKEAFGTAANYRDTKSFYMKYTGLTSVDFSYFTKETLYEIQKQATKTGGMAAGNVYRHARQLRAIFNMAVFEQAIDKNIYPFHKRGYIIPQTTKRKKSLS